MYHRRRESGPEQHILANRTNNYISISTSQPETRTNFNYVSSFMVLILDSLDIRFMNLNT